jgi:pyridoxamine 5'-phosphate oxidase
MDLETIRREYVAGGLRRQDLLEHPVDQFARWMEQAIEAGLPDPTAMTLATVDGEGCPSQRIVLLKGADRKGFIFYTNLESKKARDIRHNPRVSLHFAWLGLDRQVKIQGLAAELSRTEALRYFVKRPKESQLAALVSPQSSSIPSRQWLEAAFQQAKQKFADGKIPLPDRWGGFRVQPTSMEFWQGGPHRLHDRFVYRSVDQRWMIERLAP